MTNRYKTVKGSESGHCCFEATVLDTARERACGGAVWMCECFEVGNAIKIEQVLNDANPSASASPYLDAYGKPIFLTSALIYMPRDASEVMLIPESIACNLETGSWKLRGKTLYGVRYLVCGHINERNEQVNVLAATAKEVSCPIIDD